MSSTRTSFANLPIVFRQRVGELGVVGSRSRSIALLSARPRLAPSGRSRQMRKPRLWREIDDAARLEGVRSGASSREPGRGLSAFSTSAKRAVGVAQEQEPQHRPGIFGRLKPEFARS